ncbi:GntR family transcriptional regulator [Lentisalinibacter sediminis]|uniref:GntR family transcriptional regulator n=1 Tax=Lentisalinibacter sediminis TaxID=2992237 RepID=UPI0038701DE7
MKAASDKAYRMLRDRIFSGDYPPGARLKERELCADLEVSRTPVREALRRLEADGLVQIEPRRGGVVRQVDAAEVEEIFALGAVIEGFAAKLAAQKADAAGISALEDIVDAMGEVLERGDERCRSDYMNLDGRLHARIVALAESPRLSAALQQVVGVPLLAQALGRYSLDYLQQSLDQHRVVVEAIRQRNPEWAESAMRYHILAARTVMLASIETD